MHIVSTEVDYNDKNTKVFRIVLESAGSRLTLPGSFKNLIDCEALARRISLITEGDLKFNA